MKLPYNDDAALIAAALLGTRKDAALEVRPIEFWGADDFAVMAAEEILSRCEKYASASYCRECKVFLGEWASNSDLVAIIGGSKGSLCRKCHEACKP